MTLATKPLLELCAADLMSTNLVMISQEMSLPGAARLLARAGVGGAPVVDAEGRCVGVLSNTDYLQWAEGEHGAGHRRKDCMCSAWQIPEAEATRECLVKDYMTTDPVTAGLNTRIGDLAPMMVDAHIHRVIIVDCRQSPIGIVSTTDLLAALARADSLREAQLSHVY